MRGEAEPQDILMICPLNVWGKWAGEVKLVIEALVE